MPTGIYKHRPYSEEEKKKISLTMMGKKNGLGYRHTEEARKKMSLSHMGKPSPRKGKYILEESEKKARAIKKENKPKYKCSEETKLKIKLALLGKKYSEETRKKMSLAKMGNKYPVGYKHTEEARMKMSLMHIGKMKGDKNSQWRGGLSFEPYSVDWTETLRRSIRERDHYICQLHGGYGNSVHHIDYDKKNCNPSNLITLCKGCNIKVNTNRKHWMNHFKLRLSSIF